ncbi:Sulfite exporter TauE/SafE [Tsuneonella dongtanensis]|uniref:Probable membrane transporter protein n=1 Tax=Tsuneonella dongtanensis TaxID=692370 RepID=A0A1B2A9R9_9SPHN|nr:sulfite exporter TauE/SafE family protein [Tsuneonella dongtanensis]ANY18900.1 Sulfite exporter TauE/SafE [Tsuneonella dongtanensis]
MILGLTAAAIATGIAAALVAGIVRGLAGFGLAILLVPVFGLAATPQEAVVAANWLGVLMGFAGLRRVVREAERSAIPISILAVAATPLGVILLGLVPAAPARVLIAFIAIAAFVAVLLPQRPIDHRPTRFETGATGITSGLLTGFAGMPGPPVVPYYLRRALPPSTARSSMLLVFFATSLAGASSALALGVADWRAAIIALLLWPVAFVGNWIGFKAHDRVGPRTWRIVAGLVLGLAAGGAVLKLVQAGA